MTPTAQPTAATNAEWFKDNDHYAEAQTRLVCYRNIQRIVEREVRGAGKVLDIGNGGFFNFDTTITEHVTAVDLFVKDGPGPTPNSTFKEGSFLDLPFPDGSFDCAIQQNVLHHVTGRTVRQNHDNLRKCVSEMFRVLRPGGKAVLIESTVGPLFYQLERLVYRPVLWVKRGGHPVTFQYTPDQLKAAGAAAGFALDEFTLIPRGWFILQLGYIWPCALTPAKPVKLVFRKPASSGRS